MAGILDSLFGDLQGTSAGGLLGLLGGGNIGTATRRLRTPEEEQQAALKGDYLGVTPQVPQAFGGNFSLPSQVPSGFPATAPPQDYVGTPGALDPKWQALLAGNTDPYQPNAQLPPTATPTVGAQNGPGVTLPQLSDGGFGRDTGPQNPLMGLLGGIGNLFGASSAQAAPAPGTAQQPNLPAPAAAGPGLLGRLSAGANSLEGNNPFSALINGIQGLATGQRNDVRGIALQTQAATEQAFKQALVDSGKFTPQQAASFARAAVFNPEIAKTLAQEFDMKPQLVDMGTDPLSGMKLQGEYDPRTHRITPLTPGGQGGTAGQAIPATQQQVLDKIRQARESGVPTDKLYDLLPESIREGTRAMVEGHAIPTNMSNRGAARDLALRFGHAIDPNFDETLIPQRVTFAKSMGGSGPTTFGGQIQSAGTIVKHLGDAYQVLPTLEAGLLGQTDTLNALNPAKSYIRGQIGDKKFLDAKGQYDIAIKGIAGEMERLLSGHGGAESSKQYWMDRLGLEVAPTTRRAALDEARSLMFGRLSNIAEQKDRAYGGETDPLSFLGRKEQEIAKRITAGRYREEPQETASQQPMRPIDKAAIDWANANPKDPRAAAIKQRLGVQ